MFLYVSSRFNNNKDTDYYVTKHGAAPACHISFHSTELLLLSNIYAQARYVESIV